MGHSMLITHDNKRKGFKIDSESADKIQKPFQDTPKEDNILCTSCEKYLAAKEREFANSFYKKFKDPEFYQEFSSFVTNGGIKYKCCSNVDYCNFKLVIYSMLFRASISSLPYFSDTKLNNVQIEKLRQIIRREIAFEDISIIAITSESDNKSTNNYIYSASISPSLNYLWVNDFIFFIAFDECDPFLIDLKELTIKDFTPVKIGIVENETWNEWRKGLMMLKVQQITSALL